MAYSRLRSPLPYPARIGKPAAGLTLGTCDELAQHLGRTGVLLCLGDQFPCQVVHPFLQRGGPPGEDDAAYLPADLRGGRAARRRRQGQYLLTEPDGDLGDLARAPAHPVGRRPGPVDLDAARGQRVPQRLGEHPRVERHVGAVRAQGGGDLLQGQAVAGIGHGRARRPGTDRPEVVSGCIGSAPRPWCRNCGPAARRPQRPAKVAFPGPFSMKLRIPVRWSSVAKSAAKFSRSISRPVSRSDSSPASMACLAARSATAGPVAYLATRPRAASYTSASGTTLSTRPICSASAAATKRPVKTMSLARAGPMSRGSRWVPPAPGMMPSRISGWPTRAPSPTTRKSAHSASSRPPPSAYPVTAATTGLPILATAVKAACSRRLSKATWAKRASAISLMSAPAAKTFSPP